MDFIYRRTMNSNELIHSPTPWEDVLNVRTRLTEYISGSRLAHTLSVEKQALDMAKIIFPACGIDEIYFSDVSCSALLHDLTKHFSLDEQLGLCEKYNIPIDEVTEKNCAMLHSKTAAHLAKELFSINDCVFEAIYNHTVGADNMSMISKIVFLADYIEPCRTPKSCKEVRDLFYSYLNEHNTDPQLTLDFCIIKSIDYTLQYLLTQNLPIHIQTIKTRNCILENVRDFDHEKQF